MKKLYILALASFFIGCGGGGSSTTETVSGTPVTDPCPVTTVSSMSVGTTYYLKSGYKVEPVTSGDSITIVVTSISSTCDTVVLQSGSNPAKIVTY